MEADAEAGREPPPDFSKWHNPNIDAARVLDVWTSTMPHPNKPTVVIIGSGPNREGNIKHWLNHLSTVEITVICIDHQIGGYGHDWTTARLQ